MSEINWILGRLRFDPRISPLMAFENETYKFLSMYNFCITINFNDPLKAYFSNKEYILKSQHT